MKGPTTNFKLLTFRLFAPSLEIEKKKKMTSPRFP